MSLFSREDEGGAGGVERSWPADPRPPVPGEEDASGPDPQPPYGDWGKESPLAILPYPSHHLYAHFQGNGPCGFFHRHSSSKDWWLHICMLLYNAVLY